MKNPIFALSIIASLTACIGGEDLPNYYTGATEPAEITTDNTTDIIEVVNDSNMSGEFTEAFSGANFKTMRKGVRSALSLSDASTLAEGGTVEGDCGGTLTMDVNKTSGSIKFNDFCEIEDDGTETTTNGSLTMSGSTSSTGGGTFKYTMDITSTDGSDTSKAAGTLSMTLMTVEDELITTLKMNLTSTESKSDDSIMLDDYTIKTSGFFSLTSMSGKICTTDIAGCVTVSTPVDFTLAANSYNEYTAGTLQIDSGSSEVTISVNSDGDCDLSVDVDGDGTADSSDTQDCSNYL